MILVMLLYILVQNGIEIPGWFYILCYTRIVLQVIGWCVDDKK